jgi:magnesium-transporting ATPase (P-type)
MFARNLVLQEMLVMELLLLAQRMLLETLYATVQQLLVMMYLFAQLIPATSTLEFVHTLLLNLLNALNCAILITIASNGQFNPILTKNARPQNVIMTRRLVLSLIN